MGVVRTQGGGYRGHKRDTGTGRGEGIVMHRGCGNGYSTVLERSWYSSSQKVPKHTSEDEDQRLHFMYSCRIELRHLEHVSRSYTFVFISSREHEKPFSSSRCARVCHLHSALMTAYRRKLEAIKMQQSFPDRSKVHRELMVYWNFFGYSLFTKETVHFYDGEDVEQTSRSSTSSHTHLLLIRKDSEQRHTLIEAKDSIYHPRGGKPPLLTLQSCLHAQARFEKDIAVYSSPFFGW